MTTATDNTIPISEAQDQGLGSALECFLLHGWDGGDDSADVMEWRGDRLTRCASVKRALEQARFPATEEALVVLGELEAMCEENVEMERNGPNSQVADLLYEEARLTTLRSIREAVRV